MPEEKIDGIMGNKMQLIFPKWENADIGYIWVFPRRSAIHVGAGSSSQIKAKYLGELIEKTIHDYVPELKDKSPTKKRGTLLPHPSGMPSRLSGNRVLIAGDSASAVNAQGEGNYYSMIEGSVGAEVVKGINDGKFTALDKYSEILMPLHLQLDASAKKMGKMLNSRFLKGVLFGLVPKSEKLTQKFTQMVRKSQFNAQDYNLLQL
jgi:flavin-dependent dehydrogenase